MANLLKLYFSAHGRLSRRELALFVLLPFVLFLFAVDRLPGVWLGSLLWLIIAWPLFVATPWKRFHDTGRSGRWNLIFLGFYALGFGFFFSDYVTAEGGIAALFDGQDPRTTDGDLSAGGLGGFSTVLIFLPIHLFWLYAVPSQPGDNRYGPQRRVQRSS